MTVKLRTTQIGLKKPIEVHANLKNVDKADEMMIALLSLNVEMDEADQVEDPGESMKATVNALKKEREFTKKSLAFLQDVLKLTNKQIDVVTEHVDYTILGEYLNYVCGRIKGMSEDAFKKESKSAPKEQSANSDEQ